MLAFGKRKGDSPQCIANVLPCRINHNGPVNASERYWLPSVSEEGKPKSYIRGRKLNGRSVQVPGRYVGVVFSPTEKILPEEIESKGKKVLELGGDDERSTLLLETAIFDEVVTWGHEVVPDEKDDPYARGLEEWIAFAEQIHSSSAHEAQRTNESSQP